MTPTPITTGPGSTSFTVWLVTFLGGVASAIDGIVTPGTSAHTATYGGVGALVALAATIAKLFHDQGIHKATICSAGSEIAGQLPQLKADLATAVTFAENDVPSIKGVVDALGSRVTAIETKVVPAATTDVAAVEGIVRSVLAGIGTPAVEAL